MVQALGGGVGVPVRAALRLGDGGLEPDLRGHGNAQRDEQQGDPALEREQAGLDHAVAHGAATGERGAHAHEQPARDGAHGGGGVRDAHAELARGLRGDERAHQDAEHEHHTPVQLLVRAGDQEVEQVGGGGGDAQAVVATGRRGQGPRNDADQAHQRAGRVDVQGALPHGTAGQSGGLRSGLLAVEEVAHHHAGDRGQRDHEQPRGDAQGAGDGGESGVPLLHPGAEALEHAGLHGGGGQRVHGQGDPRAHQALTGAVPGARGAAAGQDDSHAEHEPAHHHGERHERGVVRGDHSQGGERGEPHGVHRDHHEQSGERAPRALQEDVPQHARHAESTALHHDAQHGTEDESGKDHECAPVSRTLPERDERQILKR